MRRRRVGSIAAVVAAVVVAGFFSPSSYGMTWCFDWVAYQVNGKKDTNRNSAATLRDLLRKRGYTLVLTMKAETGSAVPRPQDIGLEITRAPRAQRLDEKLKPGDVLIFGDFHTGIVRSDNDSFNHFLQIPGKTGTPYTPQEAAQSENYFVGPGRSWTLQQFFAFSREQPPEHTNDYEWATWREWLGRLVRGAPRQYPFLRSTAEVWRRTTQKTTPAPKPGVGAFPGGTATELTLTIGGVTAKTDLKTNKQTPGDPVLKAKSGTVLSGSATLNGTLPKGWAVVVFHYGNGDILLNSATGGEFSGVKPISTTFDAFTRPGAYICSTKVPPLCAPAAQANISIDWDP